MAAPRFFPSAAAFRRWLAANHARARELRVGFRKVHVARRGLTYAEALDEALCHGWIDGVRRRVDDDAFEIRFTPRRRASIWSNVNTRRYAILEREGRVTAAGRAAFAARKDERAGVYSFEQRKPGLDAAAQRAFRRHARAWAWFRSQPPWYQRTAGHWVTSARRDETRARRLATLIADSARGQSIGPLRWSKLKPATGAAAPPRAATTRTAAKPAARRRAPGSRARG